MSFFKQLERNMHFSLENDNQLLELANFVKQKAGRTICISLLNKEEKYKLNYIFCIDERIIINVEIKVKDKKIKSISSVLKCARFFQEEINKKYKINFLEKDNLKIIEKRIGNFDTVKQSLDDIADFKYEIKNQIIKNVDIQISKTISMPIKNMEYLNKFYSCTTNNNSLVYALAIEDIAKIETSKKVKLIRIIADELIRASSHLFNFSLLNHHLNNIKLMQQSLKIREVLQELKELLWNSKLDISLNEIGTVKFDIKEVKKFEAIKKINSFKKEFEVFYALVKNDETLNKIVGFGKISQKKVLDYSLLGPIARASFINNDVREQDPYLLYNELKFQSCLRKKSDAYSRAFVRLDEVREAIRLIKVSLELLPNKSIEQIKKLEIPKGESTIRIEAARGELFYYLRSEGNNKISRIITRTPTTMTWQMLKEFIPNNKIDQMPLLLNSVDPCVSCSLDI